MISNLRTGKSAAYPLPAPEGFWARACGLLNLGLPRRLSATGAAVPQLATADPSGASHEDFLRIAVLLLSYSVFSLTFFA